MSFFTIHLVHALIIALGGICYGAAITYYSPCGLPISKEFEWKSIYGTIFNALLLFGSAISSPFVNAMLKYLSRKRLVFVFGIITFIGWLFICIAQKKFSWLALVGRGITGLTCGGLSALCSMYTIEISPAECRGSYGVLSQLLATIGQC